MNRWQRPPGPLNVWKVVDGHEKLANGMQRHVKFSIQEIPNEENRKKEVYDLSIMCFLPREPLSKCLNVIEDPHGLDDYKKTFEFVMDHRISVGCYKLDSDGKLGELVGFNLLYVVTDESFKDLQKLRSTFKSKGILRNWKLADMLSKNANPFEIFQVDKFIASKGMCVNPRYDGQVLGYHMLTARSGIGEKYGIRATSTMFTASVAQQQALRAGFQEWASVDYAELVDDQGDPLFPNIEGKSAKIMMKRLP